MSILNMYKFGVIGAIDFPVSALKSHLNMS